MASLSVNALEALACVAAAANRLRMLRKDIAEGRVLPEMWAQADEVAYLVAATQKQLACEVTELGWTTLELIGDAEAFEEMSLLPKTEKSSPPIDSGNQG